MKKNIIYIAITITMIVLVCYYLYNMNGNYDGSLISSLVPYVFTVPLVASMSLWRIITGEAETRKKQKLWQKIFSFILYIMAVVVTAYFLISSKFYNLSLLILMTLLVLMIPCFYWDYKKGGKLLKNPILNWAVVMCSFYVLIFGIVFTYIQVVSPVTVEQATALVAEEYGEDTFEFIGYLSGQNELNPLGVYWFAQQNAGSDNWVEIDILTGGINTVETPFQ